MEGEQPHRRFGMEETKRMEQVPSRYVVDSIVQYVDSLGCILDESQSIPRPAVQADVAWSDCLCGTSNPWKESHEHATVVIKSQLWSSCDRSASTRTRNQFLCYFGTTLHEQCGCDPCKPSHHRLGHRRDGLPPDVSTSSCARVRARMHEHVRHSTRLSFLPPAGFFVIARGTRAPFAAVPSTSQHRELDVAFNRSRARVPFRRVSRNLRA